MRQTTETHIVRAKLDFPGGGYFAESERVVIVVDERLTAEQATVVIDGLLSRIADESAPTTK